MKNIGSIIVVVAMLVWLCYEVFSQPTTGQGPYTQPGGGGSAAVAAGAGITTTTNAGVVTVASTPWIQDINGAGFGLTNAGSLKVTGGITNGTSGQASTVIGYNSSGLITYLFNGTALYTPYDQLTNTFYNLGLPTVITNEAQSIGVNDTNNSWFSYSGNTGNQAIAANVTAFFAPTSMGTTNVFTTDTTLATRNVAPVKLKLRNLYVLCGNPGAFADSVTIMTNGTACSVTVPINNATSGSDTTHSDTIIAGVEVGIRIVSASGSTPVKWSWAFTAVQVP
jgi:hypothetical protein